MKILCITEVDHIPGVKEELSKNGLVFYYPKTNKLETIELIEKYKPQVLFVNPNEMTFRLDSEILSKYINIIATASTGTNHIDLEFCKNNNITVLSLTNEREVINKISSTAELAFGLTLSLVRNINQSFSAVKSFKWESTPFVGRQLSRLTAGVVGFGRLGSMYAKYCKAFGMKVLVTDPYQKIDDCYESVDLVHLVKQSDIISLHVHLNKETKHIINDNLLSYIKSGGCYLINTSRGDVVNEHSVLKYLESGRLLGYGTDVLSDELGNIEKSLIIKESHRLNILITSHIGGATIDAQSIAYCHVAKKIGEHGRKITT